MSIFPSKRSIQIGICFVLLLYGGKAFAQIQQGNLHLQSANGTLASGYGGQISNTDAIGSSHDLSLSGGANVGGFYYNPSFLSFQTSGYYDRAQSNSDSTSIENSSGFNASTQIFGGSSTPGSINYGQSWGTTGVYGLPGLTGLNTSSDSRNFGISWTFKKLSVLKNLSISFADTASTVLIPGLGVSDSVSTKSYAVGTSGYQFKGFSLGGGYEHLHINSSGDLDTNNNQLASGTTALDMFHVLTGRLLPFNRGKFTVSAYRTTSLSTSGGESSSNTTDELDASVSSFIWRFPLAGNLSYNDNVYGGVLQQLNAAGQTVQVSANTPRTGSLMMNLSSSYSFPHSVFVTGFASRQEEFLAGEKIGATQLGANVNYHFGRFLRGLTVLVGMNDSASQQGNNGAGLIATASYIGHFGNWKTTSNISYNQNVETLMALYTSSGMSASSMARREFHNGLGFSVSGSYSRSLFVQQAGSGNSGENANASAYWLKQSVSANYSKSSGTVIITSQGLVPVTTPGLLTNSQEPFSGQSYGLGYGNTLVKHLSLNLGWSKFSSSNSGQGVLSNVSSEQYTGSMTYTFRKLNFLANATHLHQSANNTSSLPSTTTVYYFGVSRWFNFF